jgi:hypothetical protein
MRIIGRMRKESRSLTFSTTILKNEDLYKRSDNFAFAGHGFPTNTIMLTHPRDRYYQDLDDEWQTLDFALMEQVVRNMAVSITPMLYKSK